MKKNLTMIAAFLAVCMTLLGCTGCDGPLPAKEPDVPETSAPTDDVILAVTPSEDPTAEPAHEYHADEMPSEIFRSQNLVILTAKWCGFPVYACMAADGELYYYVFAHDESTGTHGLLRAYIETGDPSPIVTIDYESGFTGLPELAVCDTAESAKAADLCYATIPGIDDVDPENPVRRMYCPFYDGKMRDGAIPVEIREREDGMFFVMHEVAPDIWMELFEVEYHEPEETLNPEETEAPQETPEATQKPDSTHKPSNTQKPTATPKPSGTPTATPKPTAGTTPTPYVWKCQYCGKSFGDDYEAWYQHAWYNPGCYAAGYAVTPVPATPTPRPGGHYEERWVVDVPAVYHTVWHCNVCGWESTDWDSFGDHQVEHVLAGEGSGYHDYTVCDQEEQGHWETVWVPDP